MLDLLTKKVGDTVLTIIFVLGNIALTIIAIAAIIN